MMQTNAYGMQYGSVQQQQAAMTSQQQNGYGALNPGNAYAGMPQQQYVHQNPMATQQQYVNQNAMAPQQQADPYNAAREQPQYTNYEKNAATALMGFPNSIRSVTNPRTGQVEYYQTRLIVTDLQKNEWGFGINLGDSDGVVRIQGCRPNPDGTQSPGQLNPDIKVNDVLYKVQNILLTGKNPLNVVGGAARG